MPSAFLHKGTCEHRAIMETCKALEIFELAGCNQKELLVENRVRPVPEPHLEIYQKKQPKELLAVVEEKLLKDDEDEVNRSVRSGYLNAVE